MMVTFTSDNFSNSISAYISLAEPEISKFSRLPFCVGVNRLRQLMHSEHEKDTLLQESQMLFNKAVHSEKDNKLIIAYIGLATCHFHLNDVINAKGTLENALQVNPTWKSALHMNHGSFNYNPLMLSFGVAVNHYIKKEQKMNELKGMIQLTLDNNPSFNMQ